MLVVAACHRVRGWNPLTQRWVLVSVRHGICWRVVSVNERTPVLNLYAVRVNFSQWARVYSHDQRGSLCRAAGRRSVEPTVRPGLAGQVAMKRGRDPASRPGNNPEMGADE